MTAYYYNISEIQSFKSNYCLPSYVTDEITLLESLIVTNESKTPSSDKSKMYKKKVNNIEENSWSKNKPTFKTTKIESKKGVEKDINDVRISLNKISNLNYESQKDVILEHLKDIHDDLTFNTVAQFIFDIASSNKFYSKLYADLYLELILKSPIFKNILDKYVSTYKETINTIIYIDPGEDYDGYCKYVKDNDKRRAMGAFFMMLCNQGVLLPETILDIIQQFQKVIFENIQIDGKSLECEEISEIIYILVSLGKNIPSITYEPLWNDIVNNVMIMSKAKVKEYKSLSSRIVFKQLDLKDFLNKNDGKK